MMQALWSPGPELIRNSNMMRFMEFVTREIGREFTDYDALYKFSIENIEQFWVLLWRFCGIKGEMGAAPYLVNPDQMPGAQFFPSARLNFAENLLVKHDDSQAIVFRGEDKVRKELSWRQLNELVSRLQQGFKADGLTCSQTDGDRICAMMPNMPETVAAMMGCASLGGVWSSCSPDFGVRGVLDRFGQIEPKIFIVCDGYYYNGKAFSLREKILEITAQLPTLKRVVIMPYIGEAAETAKLVPNAVDLDTYLATYQAKPVQYEAVRFSHPLYILFSSGTTGVPKCIVHSVGGTLLQHLKEHKLHGNLKAGDRLFYFTTCGWMMWNWLVSGLANETPLLLYDGSPFHPNGHILFDYAEAEGMTFFGTSAKYIDAVKKADLHPGRDHDLSSLRTLASTGSPLSSESFEFVYSHIKSDIHLASISGGTDIVSCFVLGNPLKPIYRGEIQGPGLGMAVNVFSNEGSPIAHGKGELVCTKPFPAMPIGFWNDKDGQKYHNAYFARYDNIWHHGDFAEWTEHGGIIIHGRSDATLNPGGVRIGTAEIYAQVEQLEEVKESIVIGQDWDGDVRVVLFVVLKEGVMLSEELKAKIKKKIRDGASPRHVPAVIIQVPDIPRTKSGKITELAVRDVVHGRDIQNKTALANPEALEFYKGLKELRE